MAVRPALEEIERAGIRLLVDREAARRGLVVAFTDRRGGDSPAPFDTLNLSLSVGDDDARVAANRALVGRAAGWGEAPVGLVHQVHGATVVADEGPRPPGSALPQADAVVTALRGRPIGVLTADCVPVVVASNDSVAAAHAGWRGLVSGVIGRAVEAIPGATAAWVGPSIHACCYEVGPEVVAAFRAAGLPVASERSVDVGRAAVVALRSAGIGTIASTDRCTSCDERYFSYRRDGTTGRQGGFACLLP